MTIKRLRSWQSHREFAARVGLTDHRDVPAVQMSDLLGDSQPQSEASLLAAARPIYPIKAVKDMREMLRRNSDPGVGNGKANLTARLEQFDADSTTRGGVFDSIFQQV